MVIALTCVAHAALADASNSSAGGANGNGPVALNMPFAVWADEGAKGKQFTPMRTLVEQAHRNGLAPIPSQRQQARP
jgi:hypothetical protein